MRAKEFVEMCYEEKEIQLKEYMNGNESLVAKLKNELALSNKQEKILYELLDTVLTDTYITLFDKSVFISGFTINCKFAKEFETKIFDGSLLYQLYLLAEVTQKYPSAYFHQPLTQATEGGTPFFGSSEAEKKLYTPGTITIQNSLNFMNWYLRIINYISDKYKNGTADKILLNMSKYSYPVLAVQRDKGRKQFKIYARELAKLGFNKSVYFYIYYWSLFLFGTTFNNTIIRTLKKIIGRRPKL